MLKDNNLLASSLKGEDTELKSPLTFDQAELTQMISVVRRVEDVSVVQLVESDEFAKHLFHRFINTLKRLKSFRHEHIGEFVMNGFHLSQPPKDPLLIGIGRKVVAGSPVTSHIEEHVGILRS